MIDRRLCQIIILAGLLVLQAGCASLTRSGPDWPFNGPVRAVWVWGADKYAQPERMSDLAAFCASNRVGLVMADLGLDTEDSRLFVSACRRSGLRVHLLAGDPSFARKENHSIVVSILRELADYNKSVPEEARIQGLHLDVEPYLLDEFKQGLSGKVLREYLSMLKRTVRTARRLDAGLLVGADIPFWFDRKHEQGDKAYMVRGRSFYQLIIDVAHYSAIMSYRDRVDGADGIIDVSRNEMTYAAREGKMMFIGLETGSGQGIPDKTTFAGHDYSDLVAALEGVESFYRGGGSFAGVAIHHYDTWREMR